MARPTYSTWPALIVLILSFCEMISASSNIVDQLVIDDLDLGIGRWQEMPQMSGASDLVLMPNALNFPRVALSSLSNHAVTIYNKNHNKTVYLNSVFALPLDDGQHNDFHVPFVRDQAVPPQGNFTFTVVFLPTRIGSVQTEILIRTSFGQLKYHVQGVAVVSPFKVIPLTHLVSYAGVNSNAAIIPDIALYNPFEVPIQITEVFSSGGKFYLELPTQEPTKPLPITTKATTDADQESESRTELWTIAAYEKRPIIRVRFVGSLVAGNYSAYIRMKVVCPEEDEVMLVIPIRMEVRAMQPISLYPEKSLIDLGSVLLHEKRPLSINIHTSDTSHLGVASLAWDLELAIGEATTRLRRMLDCSDIVVGDEKHVRLKIECDLEWTEVVRNLSQWSAFVPGSVMHVSGGVTVNSTVGLQKSPQVHRIPLFAELITGTGLELPQNVTVLFPRPEEVAIGIFYLRNNFDTPIVLKGLRLVPEKAARRSHPVLSAVVEHFDSATAHVFPTVLKSGESWTVAPVLRPLVVKQGKTLKSFTVHLEVSTNVTDLINVPLYGYSGRLTKLILSPDVRSGLATRTTTPTASALKDFEMIAEEDAELIDFVGIRLNVESHKFIALLNDNPVPIELLKWNLTPMDVLMNVFHFGCMDKFKLGQNKDSLMQPDDWCIFSFTTTTTWPREHNGSFLYDTNFESSQFPIRISGNPGTLTLHPSSLVMQNCFPKTICIADIVVESTYTETVQLHDIVTHKEASVHVFTKEIAPNAVSKVGMMYFNPRINKAEPRGYTNGYSNQIFDRMNTDSLRVLQQTAISMYRVLQDRQFLLPFQINTDRQTISSSVSVNFIWPRLIGRRDILTKRVVMVGQKYSYNISLLNPSDEGIGYWYFFTDDRPFITSLPDASGCADDSGLYQMLGNQVLSTTGNKGQQKFVVPPGEYRNITINVSGKVEPGTYASLFVLKNNFTFFEAVWQQVEVVQPKFKFGNRKPFSTTPLLFEVQDQPQACGDEAGPAAASTKRVFTAKNTGPLPIVISDMSINGESCSGYGFVILNCSPFVLVPEGTHKVEISFVPDFTVSRVERKLDFYTEVDFPIQYTLVGVVPQPMVDRCRVVVNRPWWEASLKKWALSMLATIALIVATVAYFESVKILKDHSEATNRQRGPFQAPLDFRKLAAMNSTPVGGGAGVDAATKDNTRATKKKSSQPPPPSKLFNNKRFSWFINRSQQVAAAAKITPLAGQREVPVITTTATANDKKPVKNAQKNSDRSASNATEGKTVAEPAINKKVPGKKEVATAPAKKNKAKGKTSTHSAKPVDPEPKVEPKVIEPKRVDAKTSIVDAVVPPKMCVSKTATPAVTVSLITPPTVVLATPEVPLHHTKEANPGASAYGKTPGRERKEKQQVTANHNLPAAPAGRANKVSLFQPSSNNYESHPPQVTDPWTSACRGLFQANNSSESMDGARPSHSLGFAAERGFDEQFVPNLNFNELPRDVSGMNGGRTSTIADECPENPLGAIGTIPPVSKNYSLFDTENRNPVAQQAGAGYGNRLLNHSTYYNNGFGLGSQNMNNNHALPQDFHGNYPPMAASETVPMDSYGYELGMFESRSRPPQDLYAEYQYQKQELQRLALLLAMNQAAQTSADIPQNMPQNTHINNTPNMNGYMGWDEHLRQQMLLQHHQRQQFGRPTGGPPPGMAPRTDNGTVDSSNNGESSSNQYDPFRSIWNQWNSNQ